MSKVEDAHYDVFISHASEDKEAFVAPLALALHRFGLRVWYDEFSLELGDSLSESIDAGLYKSKFGLVVLSQHFFAKSWPRRELQGLTSKEIASGKTVLPLWYGVGHGDVLRFSPPLADKKALVVTSEDVDKAAIEILKVVQPDRFHALLRIARWRQSTGKVELMPRENLVAGKIRHAELPESLLIRIKIVHNVLADVEDSDLNEEIDNYRRDLDPEMEVMIWERMVASYQDAISGKDWSVEKRRDAFSVVFQLSNGLIEAYGLPQLQHLSPEECVEVIDKAVGVVPKIVTPVGSD